MNKPIEDVQERDRLYNAVSDILTDGIHCYKCPHYMETRQAHPYGDTVAYETFALCDILEDGLDPLLCPVLVKGTV